MILSNLSQKNTLKAAAIFLYTVLACLAMVYIELVLIPGYWVKAVYKFIFFLLIPLYMMHRGSKGGLSTALQKVKPQRLKPVLILSFISAIILIAGYFAIRRFLNVATIAGELGARPGVGVSNFIPIAIYIALVNSFVEEFFFRGFNYLMLRHFVPAPLAMIFSSLSFGLYHIGIIDGWFSPLLFTLAVSGLAIVGAVFCFLDHHEDSILPAWLFHICGNIAINSIGLVILGFIKI